MKMHIQFFAFIIAVLAGTSTFAQGAGKVSVHDISFMTFNAESNEDWIIKEFGSKVKDGRHVLATYKKDKSQVIAVVRAGKIAQVGILPVGGQFKALTPTSSPCLSGGFCTTFQAKICYYINGVGCVCVCGGFLTSGGGAD